jgi:hypothetical protein
VDRRRTGAAGAGLPFLTVDRVAREAARSCLTWQGHLWAATGDEQAASQARQALRQLKTLEGP